ncbi:DUF3592 domain-containing protein [Streptomyces sp. NPDC005209]|uniref:DUF3592 domain-containing protein n=1 Tax=Streptomyces sp. NPDC005209 TaxID=3156715 RepID=UPI0033B3D7F4
MFVLRLWYENAVLRRHLAPRSAVNPRTGSGVVGIRESTDGDGDAQRWPQVRYAVHGGREVEGGARAVGSPLSEDDRVELLYRPEDPERIILIA